ncbi:MAG TPA: toll/interleukin-1 receptor domain-containing protein [Xanthomonadales bacterium]|nr:toll/interleukin-1 receptor domain-containing protein [Xanthomonadales bacterium]
MGAEFRYRAFLSYSHEDGKWAEWLHKALERYRVPKHLRSDSAAAGHILPRNLRPVFRDRDELASASSLPNVIEESLTDSESLIIICSPAAARSRWVNEEVKRFQALGRGDRIFCLIIAGEPLADDELDCFPPALRKPDANGIAAEPIAADARGGRHARNHAKMMLIAGLLDVRLDKLLQRDIHRRHRRMFAITAGSALLAIMMAGLATFAFMAKSESERRREDAENLVGFMLGDLREDLHGIGRLDLYTTVADEAMDYFQSLDEDDARDEVLAQRALALRQIGSSRLDQGDLPGAMQAYVEARDISELVAANEPARNDWQLALAESHFSIGEVHWQLGEYEAAQENFLKQLAVVDALSTTNQDDVDLLLHSGYAWTNFGRIMENSGKLEDALVAYEKVMAIFQRFIALEPDSTDARIEVGFAHNNLGKLKMALGLLEESEMHMREDLEIKLEIHREDTGNNLWREYLLSSEYWLSRVLLLRGNYAGVEEHGASAVEWLDGLLITDPTMTRWRHRRADVSRTIASACRLKGSQACAAIGIEASLDDLDELTAINSDNASWQRSYAHSQLEAAWQAANQDKAQDAQTRAEIAQDVLESLIEAAPEDRDTRKLQILVLITLGDLAVHGSEMESANSHWQSAQSLINQWFNTSEDPEILDAEALLMMRLGQLEAALDLESQLSESSYRRIYPSDMQ